MNPTGKAGKPRPKPPDLKGRTQFDRFAETAKALEVDESGEAFECGMKVLAPPKPQPRRAKTPGIESGGDVALQSTSRCVLPP